MWYLIVFAIFSYAAAERFYRITEIGLYGSDVFFYFETAKKYLAGQFEATEHFRPLAYALYAFALKLGGVNFYSIKILNGTLDLLNIAVILLLSLKLIPNRWFALLPAFFYTMLTEPAMQSRIELLHVPATLPFLLCCFLMIYVFDFWKERRSFYYLFAAGIALGFATNLHPSLNLLGPLFALTLLCFTLLRTNETKEIQSAVLRTGIFTGGFVLVYLFAFSVIGFQNGLNAFMHNQSSQSRSNLSTIENLTWSFSNFLSGNSSFLVALCIYILCFIWIWMRRPQRHHFFFTMAFILTVGYAVLYALLVPKFQLIRTFLPLLPLLLIVVSEAYYDLSRNSQWKKWFGVFAIVACVFSLRPHPQSWLFSIYEPTAITVDVYNVLHPQLASDDKILVLPLIPYRDRKPFAQPAYFGDAAEYVIESSAPDLKTLLNPANYRWVLLLKDGLDPSIATNVERGRLDFEKRLTRYLNMAPEKYDLQQEAQLWQQQTLAHGYRSTFQSDRYELFERIK